MKGIVYLICDSSNNLYKIGVTKGDIQKRLKKLQTGNPTELFLASYFQTDYPYRLETMLHNHFGNKNKLNEWFELSFEDTTNFKNTCEMLEERINSLKNNPFFMKDIH